VKRYTGILFVGTKQCKTHVPGIVRSAAHVEIGESGIVIPVINVLMEYPCHVSTAAVPGVYSPNKAIPAELLRRRLNCDVQTRWVKAAVQIVTYDRPVLADR
jgi:hypothetical protein